MTKEEVLRRFTEFCEKMGGRVVQDKEIPTIYTCELPEPKDVDFQVSNKFTGSIVATIYGEGGALLQLRGLKRITVGNYISHTWADIDLKPVMIDIRSSGFEKAKKITINLAGDDWVVLSFEK